MILYHASWKTRVSSFTALTWSHKDMIDGEKEHSLYRGKTRHTYMVVFSRNSQEHMPSSSCKDRTSHANTSLQCCCWREDKHHACISMKVWIWNLFELLHPTCRDHLFSSLLWQEEQHCTSWKLLPTMLQRKRRCSVSGPKWPNTFCHLLQWILDLHLCRQLTFQNLPEVAPWHFRFC